MCVPAYLPPFLHASIWICQLLYVSRSRSTRLATPGEGPSEGRDARQSAILGVFHRLCKLLYHRALPILVFDGRNKPQLKRSTLRMRKRQRDALEMRRLLNKLIHDGAWRSQDTDKATDSATEKSKAHSDGSDLVFSEEEEEEEGDVRDFLAVPLFSEPYYALPLEMQQRLLAHHHRVHERVTLGATKNDAPVQLLSSPCDTAHAAAAFSRGQISNMAKKGKVVQEMNMLRATLHSTLSHSDASVCEKRPSSRVAGRRDTAYYLVKENKNFGWTLGSSLVSASTPASHVSEEEEFERVEIESIHSDSSLGFGWDAEENGKSEEEGEPVSFSFLPSSTDTKQGWPNLLTSKLNEPKLNPARTDNHVAETSPEMPSSASLGPIYTQLARERETGPSDWEDYATKDSGFMSIDPIKLSSDEETSISTSQNVHMGMPIRAGSDFEETSAADSKQVHTPSDVSKHGDTFPKSSTHASASPEPHNRDSTTNRGSVGEALAGAAAIANGEDDLLSNIQQLLRILGIPYMVSPLEAEAQCAYLCNQGYVDGIITDDSDVFLYRTDTSGCSDSRAHSSVSARRFPVYKNVFKHDKYVEAYWGSDVESKLGLSQSKCIMLAYLLGSDYSDGLPGVGPVTGMEIASLFRSIDDFVRWYADDREPDVMSEGLVEADEMHKSRIGLRGKLKRLIGADLPPGFPDPRIAASFMEPVITQIPSSPRGAPSPPEGFFPRAARPNVDALARFMQTEVGWSAQKVMHDFAPIMKRLVEPTGDAKGSQRTLDAYMWRTSIPAKTAPSRPSKRFNQAIERLTHQTSATSGPVVPKDGIEQPKEKKRKK